MKDAKGHGSNPRGYGGGPTRAQQSRNRASNAIGVANQLRYSDPTVTDYHPMSGPEESTFRERYNAARSRAAGPSEGVMPQYNEAAVNRAIDASRRGGSPIGGREAKAIHALLRGRS